MGFPLGWWKSYLSFASWWKTLFQPTLPGDTFGFYDPALQCTEDAGYGLLWTQAPLSYHIIRIYPARPTIYLLFPSEFQLHIL